MQNYIPLSVPNIKGNEKKYVNKALDEEWVSSSGPYITEFENNFKEYLSVESACACQSGTAGLHLCLVNSGIGKDDIVIVPTLTFIATINAVMYQNATPVFIDCDESMGMDAMVIKKYIENHCIYKNGKVIDIKSNKQVKAIIPVHVFGNVCNLEAIMRIAKKYGLCVIEDATESLGTRFINGQYAGLMTGTIGDYGVFSFNGNKIITTGGGGMVVSNNRSNIGNIRYLSTQAKNDMVYFVHNEIGYNYRLTNVQAAIGLGQLESLDRFINIKKKNFLLYKKNLHSLKFGKIFDFDSNSAPNYWFYSLLLNEDMVDKRDELINFLRNKGIQTRPIWKLNHTQKPFVNFDMYYNSEKRCEDYYNRVVNLPCSTSLNKEDIEYVCKSLFEFGESKC